MLQSLYIQNYALIETLEIQFERGFSVITGETGAGKSIILGAIGLLLGQRADSKSIKNGASKCIIEAHFNLSAYSMESYFTDNNLEYDNGECILRRELSASGKSRAFINDTPVSLTQMKELGEQLIDVHSQHQNLLLNKEKFQLQVLDIIANNTKEVETYKLLFNQFRTISKELKELIEQAHKSKNDEDYIRFQLEQLDEAQLTIGEQSNLEQEADQLNHAEEIKSGLYSANQYMNPEDGSGILHYIKDTIRHLRELVHIFPPIEELLERIESTYIELKDISEEINSHLDKVEFNPARLEFINERLNSIYSLEQKHHVQTLEELLTIADSLKEHLLTITSYDEHIADISKKKEDIFQELLKQGTALTQIRKQAAKEVEKQIKEHLMLLGMPNVRFEIEFLPRKEPDINGMDNINFLFSANKNSSLQNIVSVASGGEIARVMLSIKAMITGAVKLPTIIFDEIDTGVSGKIAERMAYIMQEMGQQNRQVISITHLPQIAAMGEAHYRVYKEDNEHGTTSHLSRLNNEERINEIAHMLSGEILTEAAISNAKELLRK